MTAIVSDVTKNGFKVRLSLPRHLADADADSVILNWVAVSVPSEDDESYLASVFTAFNLPEMEEDLSVEGYYKEGTSNEDTEYKTLVFV